MSEPAAQIAITTNDALDDVIDRIRDAAAGGQPVALSIPAESALFLTASEFRALKSAVDRGRIVVTVRSADPLRLQLARMLGLDATPEVRPPPRPAPPAAAPVQAEPFVPTSPAPAPAPDPAPAKKAAAAKKGGASASPAAKKPAPKLAAAVATVEDATPADKRPKTAPTAPKRAKAKPAAIGPAAAPPASPSSPVADDAATARPRDAAPATATGDEQAAEIGDAWPEPPPPVVRPRPLPLRERLKRAVATRPRGRPVGTAASGDDAAAAPSESVGVETTTSDPVKAEPAVAAPADDDPSLETVAAEPAAAPWWRRSSPRNLPLPARIAVVAVAVLLVAALGYAILAPRAAIRVALAREPVAATLIYDVTADGSPLDPGAELAIEAERQTVDVLFDASIPTTGTRAEPDQTATGEIRLANPMAEEIRVERGTIVSTESGVDFATVDAVAVPGVDPSDGRAGTAVVSIRALEPGTGGNVTTGEIGGRLESGIYYSNRDRATDGGTDRSIPIVAAADLESLRAKAATEIPALAESAFAEEFDGMVPIPGSLVTGRGSDEFSAEEGAETERLSLRMLRPITAFIYDPTAVREEAAAELRQRLDAETPTGYRVDDDTIELAEASVIEDQERGTRFEIEATAESLAEFTSEERRDLAQGLAGKDPADAETVLDGLPQIERFEIAYHPSWFPNRMPSNPDRITWEFTE